MISTSCYPVIGGLESYMHGLAERLVKNGHRVTILSINVPNSKEHEFIRGVEIRRINIPDILWSRQVLWFFVLFAELHRNRKNFDIIHAYPLFMTGIFASIIGRFISRPVVIREGMSSALLCKALGIPGMRFFAEYAAKNSLIYANNPESVNILCDFGIQTKDIDVLKTPVDCKLFKPVKNKNILKQKYRIEGRYTLLYVGRLVDWKNVHLLIKSMPEILSSIPNAHLFLVGDGPCRKELERLAVKLNVSHQVTFFGSVSPTDVNIFFQMADVFVTLATHSKSTKKSNHPDTTTYQAMSCSLPVISPPDLQVDSNNESLRVNEFKLSDTGIVVNISSLDSFIEAVIYLHKSKDPSKSLGTSGRRFVLKKLNWNMHLRDIENIYRKVLI